MFALLSNCVENHDGVANGSIDNKGRHTIEREERSSLPFVPLIRIAKVASTIFRLSHEQDCSDTRRPSMTSPNTAGLTVDITLPCACWPRFLSRS